MATNRSALVNMLGATSADVDVLEYLNPRIEAKPSRFAPKPNAIDDHVDHVIDPTKWATTGVVTEQAYLGVDGLYTVEPTTPDWDAAGMIYKPAILPQIGKVVMARAIAAHPVEFMFCLQEYAFTVDNIVTPTTWTLGYKTSPQDLRNSMGIIWRAGSLYFFEGGQPGNEEYVGEAPWRGSTANDKFPLQVAFVFTLTGWDIWAHLPGVWSSARMVKSYSRPGAGHSSYGYSFCVNKFTADDALLFYNMAFGFKSNALLLGSKIVCANTGDFVPLNSLVVADEQGIQSGQPGVLRVRFPDLGTTLYTMAQVAQLTGKLTGKQIYSVDFELSGDVVLSHPVRITIQDATLTNGTGVTPA